MMGVASISGLDMWSFVVFFICLTASSIAVTNVLILGGNGFIGSETVHHLLESDGSSMRLTLLNRGTEYWDSASRIAARVNSFYCNRNKIRKCNQLTESDEFYDFVLDFSSYRQRNIAEIIDILTNRVGLYIYVSTDSIYEVCQKKDIPNDFLQEEDAVRPESMEERLYLNSVDNYGHRKLACEELLVEQKANGGFPYVILRLPDVIGPRDNTDRWWIYQLWIQFHKVIGRPLYMTHDLSQQQISFVYSLDVAKAIASIMKDSEPHKSTVYNLAFGEVTTLRQLLVDIAARLQVADVEFSDTGTVKSYLFPSVTRGPLNTHKAMKKLHWQPTPLQQAINETTDFYDMAMGTAEFADKRRTVLGDFLKTYVPSDKYIAFAMKLAKIYPQISNKDEL
jgi:nucleoside-diphosphate-sugar epimerase